MESQKDCPCVTVLIPARNSQDFIAESLLSAIKQDHIAEILVVINDSSDNTERIVEELSYSFPKIRYINTQVPGIANALNTGIQQIETEYIARLDADDVMVENRIAKQVEFMRAYPKVDVLGSQLQYISSNGNRMGQSKYPTLPFSISIYLSFGNPIAHPSVLMRTSSLPQNPYKMEFEGVEDLALWIELAKSNNLANLDEYLTKYRQHANQVSISPKLKYQEIQLRSSTNLYANSELFQKIIKVILNFLKILWIRCKISRIEKNQ
jgi:glycosyltransferase involved in cell wall biosynthesis